MKYSLALVAAAAAVHASPFPQGVTAAISPDATAPSGCLPTYTGTFGFAVMNLTAAAGAAVTTLPDGQPGASTAPVTTIADGQPQVPTSAAVVSTINDGQPQAPTTVGAVSTIADGQPQAATTMTMGPINQIGDGQIQNQVTPVSQISDGQIQNPTAPAISTIADGQPQAPTATAISTIADGQPQAPTATAISTIGDGQPQAPTSAVGTMGDGQPTASAGGASATGMHYVSCKNDDTLEVTLAGGILTDNLGRTGYIASNYQLQFDGPPQAGALYTAGFTVCGNGSLALGGSNVFYQCLSGNFYNLYDRFWAPQCSPITIQAVELVDC